MPGPISRIEGMKEAREALRKLSDFAKERIGKNGLKAATTVLVPKVKARARVSDRANDPTRGSLHASIRDKAGRARKGMDTRAIIADDVAAVPKEFGLSRRQYPAEPWFRPAIDGGRQAAGEALAQSIKDDVEHGPWR